MENHVHASTAAKFRRLVMLAMAACLALAGLISAFAPVQAQAAEEIEITHDGTLPARWRVYWEATFSADGGTAPYTCSMTGTAPGLTFNTETCSLSGAPTQYGTFPITVTFVDSKGAAGTLDLNFEVQAKTNLALTLSSLHPDGPSVYMAGYPVRVRAVVDFSPTDPQKIPTGQVTFQAGTDGPSCTADLDLGVADCALVISEAGEWTITATYAGGSTIESSEDSKTITLKPLQVTPVLSAGYHHTCYLDETGWMRCWGLADSFPVDENDRPVPQGPFVRISAGGYQTCALKTDGTIACSGENTEITHNIPTGQFVELSAGTDHVCAIDASGKLKCWGDLTEDLAKVPTAKVSAVSAGAEFDCAIQANNGHPVCWGEMTGSPTPNVKVIDLAVGNTHACAVKENHELVCWGSPSMDLPAGNDFQTVESGSNYSCAADSDGKLICFGSGKPAVDTNVTVELFSSGFLHTCAVVDTGGQQPTLSCWGANDYGKAPRIELDPAELPSILMIGKAFEQTFTATGGNAPYSLTLDGGSLPHGLTLANGAITGTPNRSGTYTFTLKAAETFSVEDGILPLQLTPLLRQYTVQTIDGTTTTSLQLPDQVTAGSPALAQVTVSGGPTSMPFEGSVRVESADQDAYCEADVDNTGKAQCFLYFSTAGQKTVTAKFSGESYRLPSQGSDTIIVNPAEIHPLVAAGGAFSCSVDGNGRLTCWGKNDSGQAAAPAGVFDRLSLGQSHACAIGLNRRTTCWGWNGFGNATPPDMTGVLQVTAGDRHTCALLDTGRIRCWGTSADNRLAVPSAMYTAVDAGANHTCALTSDGNVKCWGANTSGQTSVPAGLQSGGNATAISAGGNFTCALNKSGSPECWGGSSAIRDEPAGTYTALTAGRDFACALDAAGSVHCWGDRKITMQGSFQQISAGDDHVCGLQTGGWMSCSGGNDYGQAPLITLGPDFLPVMEAGKPGSAQFNAGGSRSGQYVYTISEGKLPEGLILNSNTGALTGTPVKGGHYSFRVQALEAGRDPALVSETRDYTLLVRARTRAAIDSVTPAQTVVGQPVWVTFSVTAVPGDEMSSRPYNEVTVSAPENTCTVELVNGQGGCMMLFSEPGTKNITISYPGDDLHQAPAETVTGTVTVSPFAQSPRLVTGLERTYLYKADGTLACAGGTCRLDLFSGIFNRLDAGRDYVCGLRTNGQVLCQATGEAPEISFTGGPYVDLSVGDGHVCALRWNGWPDCKGDLSAGQALPSMVEFRAVSAGGDHTCALDDSGEAHCYGAITDAPEGAFVRLVSGRAHTCGLRENGAVECWGEDGAGQASVPADLPPAVDIVAGADHTCALDGEGGVTCWGDSTYGQTEGAYGKFTAVAAYDDHTCALRGDSQLTCWGEDDAGEAPQYSFNQMTAKRVTALTYFEHVFDIDGGIRPITAVVAEGSLPPGLDLTDPSDIPNRGNRAGDAVNDLSPAGMVLYGVPRMPGTYSFVIRWKDSSPVPLVMEQPYTLTVTGADLSVAFEAATVGDALEGLDYAFNVRVTNGTVFPVPDVVLTITSSAGISDLRSVHPGCAVQGQAFVCALGEILSGKTITVPVVGKVTAKNGESFQLNASVSSTNPDWPEVDPLDNLSTVMVLVASRTGVFSDDFEQSSANGWTGGFRITAPNGQTLLAPVSDNGLRLDLTNLPDHQRVTVSFDLYVAGSWLGNNPGGLPYKWRFGLAGAYPRLRTTFSNIPGMQQAYPRSLGQGSFPAMTGADGVNLLGIVQEDGSPVPDALYRMSFTFQHTAPDLSLVFESLNLPEGAAWALDSVRIEADTGWTQVYLPAVSATR